MEDVKTQLKEKTLHKACVLYRFHSADPGPLEDTSTSPSLGHSGPRSYRHTDCYTERHMCPQHKLKERENAKVNTCLGFSEEPERERNTAATVLSVDFRVY